MAHDQSIIDLTYLRPKRSFTSVYSSKFHQYFKNSDAPKHSILGRMFSLNIRQWNAIDYLQDGSFLYSFQLFRYQPS